MKSQKLSIDEYLEKVLENIRESIGEYLKELGQKDNSAEQEKQEKIRYTKSWQKGEKFFKKLKEDLNRLEKHQQKDNGDLDYKGIR